jgi:hypothetical protein
MAGRSPSTVVGFREVVQAAYEICFRVAADLGMVEAWLTGEAGRDTTEMMNAAAEVCERVACGHIREALRSAQRACGAFSPSSPADERSLWWPLYEACELIERTDTFLANLGPEPADLARGCPGDIDTLLIVADWCEERDRTTAAAEARHLHARLRDAHAYPRPPHPRWAAREDEDSEPDWE